MATSLDEKLLQEIVSHLETKQDVANVCLASRRFLAIGSEHLYRSIALVRPAATIKVCRLLARRHDLARLVRNIALLTFQSTYFTERNRFDRVLPAFLRLVGHALRACTALEGLTLGIAGAYSWVLEDTSFNLTVFKTGVVFDHSLIAFIQRQTALRELDIQGQCEDRIRALQPSLKNLPERCCPLLRCVFGPILLAIHFVQERPVEIFGSQDPVTDEQAALVLSLLLRSSRPLKSLTLSVAMSVSPVLLGSIARYAPCLETLKFIQGYLRSAGGVYFGTISEVLAGLIRKQTMRAFSSLTRLEEFEYSTVDQSLLLADFATRGYDPSKYRIPEGMARQLTAVCKVCPSLQTVRVGTCIERSWRGEVWRKRVDDRAILWTRYCQTRNWGE